MSKLIDFTATAREKLMTGVNTLADAVKSTLGPQGRNVIIEKPYQKPYITKDGAGVAKEVSLKDPVENMGAEMVRETALTTAEIAGDGTTTAIVLTQAMLDAGMSIIEKSNPIKITQGMNYALNQAMTLISQESENIKIDSEKVSQVASISANNDYELGSIIAESIQEVGKNGMVIVGQSEDTTTSFEKVDGISFNKGYMSEYFVTNPDKMVVEYNQPLILFLDQNVKAVQQLVPVIEACNTNGQKIPLVIIADDIIEQALNMIVANKMKSGIEIVTVKAPSFGDNRKDIMKDMAIATGGTYISDSEGLNLEDLASMGQGAILSHLGDCDKVKITKNTTTFIGGKGEQDDIDLRISSINAQLEEEVTPGYKTQMIERVAKLKSAVVLLNVGAMNEVELKQKKDRVDDAVAATQAALEEGVVTGGGMTLLKVQNALNYSGEGGDHELGFKIVKNALTAPLHTIMTNAGYTESEASSVIVDLENTNLGYNALTDTWEDLRGKGVIDPTKVTKTALENAVAVSSIMLTTNVTITMDPEDKPREINPQMMGMGY